MPPADPRPPSPADASPADTTSIEEQLTALHRDSFARTAELREIVAQLPAVVGRRAMIRTFLGDIKANPNKAEIAQRGMSKAGRGIRAAARDLTRRVRRRP